MNCRILLLLVLTVSGLLNGTARIALSDDLWVTPHRASLSDQADWDQWACRMMRTSMTSDTEQLPAGADVISPASQASPSIRTLPAPPMPSEPAEFEPSDACCITYDPCCEPPDEGLLINSKAFFAGDGWKNIFDDDDNNNFGLRAGFSAALPIPGPWALRWQYGASYGAYDLHGREELLARDDPVQQQLFATAGIYKRSNILAGDDLAWGVVYDVMTSDETGERNDDVTLSQLRARFGIALNESDELGVWTAFRLMSDYASQQDLSVNVTDQACLFWHRHWCSGADTNLYVGWADDPGETVVGCRGEAPLNDRLAFFGNLHYIIPSTTGGDRHPDLDVDDVFIQETWNVSFGFVLYGRAGSSARTVSGGRGLPLIPVADNGTFAFQAPLF